MRPWTWRILLCLVLGVITTIAFSWSIACFVQPPRPGHVWHIGQADVARGDVWFSGSIQMTRSAVHTAVIVNLPTNLSRNAAEEFAARFAEQGAPSWALDRIVDKTQDRALTDLYQVSIEGFGWPARALWAGWAKERRVPFKMKLFAGIPTDRTVTRRVNDDDRLVLPSRPIAVGFALNTMFYAVVWFSFLFGFTTVRAVIRRQRGRCVRCGYDLRSNLGAGCPECGWNREASS